MCVASPEAPVAAVTKPSEKPSVAAVFDTVIACEAVPPMCWLPRVTGFGVTPAVAVRYTLPLTETLELAIEVVPRLLVPVPSDTLVRVTEPVFAPAVEVSTPTEIALLLEPPAAIRLVVPPLCVASPDAPVAEVTRPSENPSVAAVLDTVTAAEFVPPTRWLAIETGLEAEAEA